MDAPASSIGNRPGSTRQTLACLAIVLAIIATPLSVVAFGRLVEMPAMLREFKETNPAPEQVPFDREHWLASPPPSDGARLEMADAALELVNGQPATQVRNLLGEPSEIVVDPAQWWYVLGREPGPFGTDSLWLVVNTSDPASVAATLETD